MREQMIRRGPDGAGLWREAEGRIGLAHRRLAILDPTPAGTQPMWSTDGRYAIVFNGEIYNFQQLRAELARQGHHFRTHTDTEVLLELYRREGDRMCARLRGMYAAGIWDRDAQTLFLVRDPFGIKPLYLHDDGQTLRFASQVKALLAGGGIAQAVEPAGLAGYWLWGHVPEPWSLYQGVVSLPPGSWLRLERGGARKTGQFHNLFALMRADDGGPARPAAVADEVAAGGLREAMLGSVRHHLIADVPVGIFLSAGIDSSTIAALAAETGATLRTVTLGFAEYRGTPADETVQAEQVARRYGAQHETAWITQQEFADILDDFLESMDQPSTDGLNTWLVSRAAAQRGLKVVLSGLGGDELLGGYPSFRHIPLMRALGHPFSRWPALGRGIRRLATPILRPLTSVKYAGLLEYGGSWEGAYLLRRALRLPWEVMELSRNRAPDIHDIFREGLLKLESERMSDSDLAPLGGSHAIVSYLEMTRYMRHRLLRDADWASMAHSLELRTPLVDIPVLRAVAHRWSHATAGQRHRSYQKSDLAACARPLLPDELLTRSKSGFNIPMQEWLLASDDGSSPSQRGLRDWQERVARSFSLAGN